MLVSAISTPTTILLWCANKPTSRFFGLLVSKLPIETFVFFRNAKQQFLKHQQRQKMKYFSLLTLLFIHSCFPNCNDWRKKEDEFSGEYKKLYDIYKQDFQTISKILNFELEKLNKFLVNDINKNLEWNTDSLIKKDKTNKLGIFLKKIKLNSILFVNKNTIYFYPEELNKYNNAGNCPAFIGILIYNKNKKFIMSQRSNFIHKKLDDYWIIQSSISAL